MSSTLVKAIEIFLAAVAAIGALWAALVANEARWEKINRDNEDDDHGIREADFYVVRDNWHWSATKLLKKLIALDIKYTPGVDPRDHRATVREGTVKQWSQIFECHPQTWRLLVVDSWHFFRAIRRERIVGYWSFVVLKDQIFDAIKSGVMSDGHIDPEWVVPIDQPGIYKAYFSQILLEENCRYDAIRLALKSLANVLVDLAKQNVFISEICAFGYGKKGETLCRRRGMEELGPNPEFGTIFIARLNDVEGARKLANATPELDGLWRLYGKKFGYSIRDLATDTNVSQLHRRARHENRLRGSN